MANNSQSLSDEKMDAREAGFSLSWLDQLQENLRRSLPDMDGNAEGLPELSDNLTGRVHGAIPRPGIPQIGAYAFRTKREVWGYNLRKLYEEAVARQWSSATDVPWDTLEPLPDDLEAAECQLATFFNEVEFVAADIPSRFIANMSPDYMDVRQFLLTQVMDESRHMEVFRKRALANGGGLMRRVDTSTGVVGGATDNARDFTEMSTRLHVSGEGAVLTLFRLGELMAYNEAEKTIYRRAAQDEARHVAFGILHLKYMNATCPERREEIHTYLDEAETRQATGAGGENPAGSNALTSSALAVLLGGGKNKVDEGQKLLLAVRRRQVKEYFQRLKSAGYDERIHNGRVNPALLAAVKNA
ncbi:MAG: ferritin-like domain-containing protein [bacterium]|nr:ferritin-like domain-containing protein [bacterium]